MAPRLSRVDLEITSSCNLRCIHCFADSGKKRKSDLSTKRLLKFIDSISKKGVKSVSLSGGEIMTHRQFFKIAKSVSDKGMKLTLLTNATLLKKNDVKKLGRIKNLADMRVSLDGINPLTNDYIRGVKGSFEKTMSSISLLVNENIPVTIMATVMKQNVDEIPGVANWCSLIGIDYSVNPVSPLGRANSNLLVGREDYANLINTIGTADASKQGCKNFCGIGFERITVLNNGDITPCMSMRDAVLGNIKEDDVFDVFKNHSLMKEIRRANVNNIKECKKCQAKKKCGGGCRQRAFAMHGRFDAPDDVMCVLFKKKHKPKLENPENFPLK